MVKKVGKTTINQNKNQTKKKRKESKVLLFQSFTVSLHYFSPFLSLSLPSRNAKNYHFLLIFFQSNQKFQKFDMQSCKEERKIVKN